MGSPTIEISKLREIVEITTTITDHVHNVSIENTSEKSLEINSGFTSTVAYASDVIGLSNYISSNIPVALSGMASIAGGGTSNPLNLYHVVIDGGSP